MAALMEALVKALVDDPKAIAITTIQDGGRTILRIQVAASDIGKLIGKQGRTARALRMILAAASMKQHRSFELDIVPPESRQQV
jgi:predicted RNA-binding protein YlqC (UPF0109 family)